MYYYSDLLFNVVTVAGKITGNHRLSRDGKEQLALTTQHSSRPEKFPCTSTGYTEELANGSNGLHDVFGLWQKSA